MASLEGRVVKHGTTWRVVYWWHGKQEKVQIGITTKREAVKQKAKVEAMLANDENPKLSRQRPKAANLSDLITKDAEWCASRRRARTIEINTQALKKLQEFTGDKLVESFDRRVIDGFLTYLRDECKYSRTSINMYLRQIKAVFHRAVEEHGLLKEHPFRTIKPFTQAEPARKALFLDQDQIRLMLAGIEEPHLTRLIQFYLWTGCRRTEATDLKWNDVDLPNGQVYLGQSDSKTKLRRGFPLTDRLIVLLQELREDSQGNEHVFWRFSKDPRRVSKRIRRIREKAEGLPDNLTLHTLRHTFASHLIMSGVDISTVASLLGHSSTQVTELYSHLQPDHRMKAADRLPY